jgi:hypothetical protein
MNRPWFVVENIEEPPHKLFSIGSVELLATPLWWVSLVWMFAFGVAVALWFAPANGFREKLFVGFGYGLMVPLAAGTHNLGHFLGGKIAGAPMHAFLLNASIPFDLYREEDENEQPSRVHLLRALGGPVFSALVGTFVLALNSVAVHNIFVQFYGSMNCFIAIGAMFPIPAIDGEIWLRELRRWRSS